MTEAVAPDVPEISGPQAVPDLAPPGIPVQGRDGTAQPAPAPQAVLDLAPDGMLVVDATGVIRYANRVAHQLLGRDESTLHGTPFGHPLGAEPVVQIELRGSGGTVRDAEMRLTPIRTGGASGWIVAIRDITDRAEDERTLLAALTRRQDAMAVTAHELRNPLFVLGTGAELLINQWSTMPDDERLELVVAFQHQARSMSQVVNRYLDAERVQSGLFTAHPQSVAVFELIVDKLPELGTRAANVELAIPNGIAVQVDPEHLWTIVSNFLINAFRYGAPPMSVTAQRAGDWVSVEVVDHGVGVPADKIDELFQRHGHIGDASTAQGTGLGLWIGRGLAQANGGEVFYRPNNPHGSRFGCRLPAAEHDQP